jgi:hypothetical protein
MTRGLTTAELAEANNQASMVIPLLEIMFDSGALRLALGAHAVTSGGLTWVATGNLVQLEAVNESADSTEGMNFTLNGLDAGIIALAAYEPYRGRIFRLYEQWVNSAYIAVAPPRVEWMGRLASLAIDEQNGKCNVSGSAEHYDADLQRARVLRYNDSDQKRLYPGDTGFSRVEAMTEVTLVWPSKAALKK